MLTSVSLILPVPVADPLLIPLTAALDQLNVVPATVLVAVYATDVPEVTVFVRLLLNVGVCFGAAVALAVGLVQPLIFCVSV